MFGVAFDVVVVVFAMLCFVYLCMRVAVDLLFECVICVM